MPAIALCADDYGQHAGIDDAVCALLRQQRLTAVSCMSSAPRWHDAAPRLREHAGSADIGLHLNLTEGFGAPAPALNALILRCLAGMAPVRQAREAFARQCDAFEAAMGRAPDFIDGHQHVHQLPGLAPLVLELASHRYGALAPWVRNTAPLPGVPGLKPAVLARLGGNALAARLRAQGLRTNNGFGGVYGFDSADYGALFGQWLACAGEGALLMCHPGMALQEADPIARQRLIEYHFLNSNECGAQLAAHDTRLVRLSCLLPRT